MLVQTNSYIVPREKRDEHARLMRRFRQALARIGCEFFEVYEQLGPNWTAVKTGARFVQIMRFRDREHFQAVQNSERSDKLCQDLILQFSELIDLPRQQEQHQFAVGFYSTVVSGIAPNTTMPAALEQLEPNPGSNGESQPGGPPRSMGEPHTSATGNPEPHGSH